MNIKLICIGKTDLQPVKVLMESYTSKLLRYCKLDVVEIPLKHNFKSSKEAKKKEAEWIKQKIKNTDFVILLDEKGKQFSSVQFAQQIEKWTVSGNSSFVFVIGGAFGLSEELKSISNYKISLSSFTFTHQMVRPIILEQVYRAFTIIHNFPYHNE